MTSKTLVIGLNCIAAAGLTVGGASALPGASLKPVVLFYGLLVAGICKAVASTLVQYKGESDELQGITPAQKNIQANADATAQSHVVTGSPVISTATRVVIVLWCLLAGVSAQAGEFVNFFETDTNGATVPSTNLTKVVLSPAVPVLSGLENLIITNLVDDLPYVSNGVVVDFAALYNSSNPKGTGKVGFFGDITFPTTQQSAVGIGAGEVAHHSFITPVNFTVGTTLAHLPAAIGKVYTFVGDGVLYDFTGKQVGNWVNAGFYKSWTINPSVSIGLKFGTYNDSVIPGIGWFGALTGTF